MLTNQRQFNSLKNLDLGVGLEAISPKIYAHLLLYSWAGSQLPGGVIVDAGSEMGFGMKLLHHQDRKIFGIDIDLKNLCFAIQRSNPKDNFIHICGDLLKIPLAKNSCNGVCVINTIHLLDEPKTLL